MYRPTVRCLHQRLVCMIVQRAAIGSTRRFSTNHNKDLRITQSEIFQRSHKIGQSVVAYPPSIFVSLLEDVCLLYYVIKSIGFTSPLDITPYMPEACNYVLFHVKALKDLKDQVTQYFSCQAFLLSSIYLSLKVNIFKPLRGKYRLINLEIVNRPKNLNYNVEIIFKTRYCCPSPPHNIILFKLDFDVKFPLLRLL